MKAFVVLSFIVVTGCYGAAPPTPPRIPLPDIRPGLQVLVDSQSETHMGSVSKKSWTCPQGHIEGDPLCSYTTYSVVEPITSTKTTVTYGGEKLEPAQLAVMADTEQEAKRTQLADLQRQCTAATRPRHVGMVGVIGGLVLWGIAAGSQQPVFTYVGAGVLGVGIGGYTYGYLVAGGDKCSRAETVAASLTGRDHYYGDNDSEMHQLADQFNARVIAPQSAQTKPARRRGAL
ncbi:MAG TPA: hypothetical protein VGM90_39700 [Kofleriaceae bacterium]|jgi:hypothetical protein